MKFFKYAVNLNTLQKALRSQKPIRHLRVKPSVEGMESLVMGEIPKGNIIKTIAGISPQMHSKETNKITSTLLKKENGGKLPTELKYLSDATKPLRDTPTMLSNKGGPVKFLQKGLGIEPKDYTPKQLKTTGYVTEMHERAENQVAKKLNRKAVPMNTGHVDPDVLLREHNVLTTMPKSESKHFMDSFSEIRDGEFIGFSGKVPHKGYKHGKSPRLSRHARKRVRELMIKRREKT